MGPPRPLPALAALVIVLLSAAAARALDPPTNVSARPGTARVETKKQAGPTPMVERGLILPLGLLDPYVGPFVDRPPGGDKLRMGASFGALWGFWPEMHVDVQIGPNYLTSRAPPGTSRVTVTGRFVKSRPLDVGASVMAVFDPNTRHDFLSYIQPGLPAIVRPNERLRVDTGVFVPLYPIGERRIGLRVPFNVYVQVTDRYHVGATSVLVVSDLQGPRTTSTLPFGFTGGYSAGPELAFLAVSPYLTWTNFYTPSTGAVDTRAFVAGVITDFIIDL